MPVYRYTRGDEEYELLDFNYSAGFIGFYVSSTQDAYICLSTERPANLYKGLYEFCIGGSRNTVSHMRKNSEEPNVAESQTPGILRFDKSLTDHTKICGYILYFAHGDIELFHKGASVLKYKDCEMMPIKYFGMKSVGVPAQWIIHTEVIDNNVKIEPQ